MAPEIMEEVSLNIDIANRISDILRAKGITQRKFAEMMGKRESEISRWLKGTHGFTTKTLAKISAILGERIIDIPHKESSYVVIPLSSYVTLKSTAQRTYVNMSPSHIQANWN
ncbi:MAG: helix-turn-helix transcriptional regulator [Coprobacter sp.]|nr:helix-turn-helix transcriptional regulator [Coprobacter sp.]